MALLDDILKRKAKRMALLDDIAETNKKKTVLELEYNKNRNTNTKSWMVVSIDGRDDATQSAKTVAHCHEVMRDIRPFQRAVLFCNKLKGSWPIEVVHIPKMNKNDYSAWCVKELWKHVTTDFVLIVQYDGYIINPKSWSENFLDYDYIGSPWPHYLTYNLSVSVGNGGFSIRSRQLCEQVANCSIPLNNQAEDVYICQTMRIKKAFNDNIKFAPPAIAARFAIEHHVKEHKEQNVDENTVFGFHMFGGPRRQPLK